MLTPILIAVLVVLLLLLLRWAFFVRVRVGRAPYCPVCREARGKFLGVGEKSGQAHYQCPHCGNVFDESEVEKWG
ncbi:MAG TPA: hypothetical protein VFZ25_11105 [Chloroflexota bacterium]|nr:hypothetical protein [Chloroflexota bacterium]